MRMFAEGCHSQDTRLHIVGDTKSPADFALERADFYSVADQKERFPGFAGLCPVRHYARKNVGYLIAMAEGAEIIVDTDDDNLPYDSFWAPRHINVTARVFDRPGWVNVYGFYSKPGLWPRGLPLDRVKDPVPALETLASREVLAPIQQGLANENPDVDAVYRLISELPVNFQDGDPVALLPGTYCPFNSQNTTWFRPAFALLYLPAYCSFRMTDIWRSFVAQRIAAENEWPILFHSATVWQDRNDHSLMRDFADEVPGYLHNDAMMNALKALPLRKGVDAIPDNLRTCYQILVSRGWVGPEELPLLDAWLSDALPLLK